MTRKPYALHDQYRRKADEYYDGVRRDYVSALPKNRNTQILEIGCGTGDTGAAALEEGRCGKYCGVEMNEAAARLAGKKLSEVIVGDVESIELPWPDKCFDALILSEVLEHLVDPWEVLRKIRPLMRDGAVVFASSPNVSHYRVLRMLLRGRWDLADVGVMDRTHLRWFTPQSYSAMFEDCGYRVLSVEPMLGLSRKARIATLIPGVGWWLFATQILLEARA